VLFFEHKKLYGLKGDVPEEEYTIPLGEAAIRRSGSHATIITYAYMVGKSLAVAEQLAKEGIEVEVIDLRTVDPLDEEKILESVKKTGHLVVVQETWRQCSISSEVAALVAEQALDYLDAPIVRVTAKDVPIPFSPVLESHVLPKEEDISDAVYKVLHRVPA
jgi:pyruvate dehydrogenase E1 component beta subunit